MVVFIGSYVRDTSFKHRATTLQMTTSGFWRYSAYMCWKLHMILRLSGYLTSFTLRLSWEQDTRYGGTERQNGDSQLFGLLWAWFLQHAGSGWIGSQVFSNLMWVVPVETDLFDAMQFSFVAWIELMFSARHLDSWKRSAEIDKKVKMDMSKGRVV